MAKAKYFKKYNSESKKWEVIAPPDVTIVHQFDDGTKISDTDVVVTNYNYTESGETTTLDETLSAINDDISRLQRNVSWLGEHGGGGGGGGGSVNPTLYGIEIISPIIENNAVYINTTSFSVKFKVTGGTINDTYRFRYIFDGTETSDYVTISNEEERTVTIKDINSVSSSSIHQFQLEAITPADTTVRQSFRIYENTLKLSLSPNNNISNGEVIMAMNGNGAVRFNVKNGIMNSNTTLHFSCNGVEASISYQNDTTSESERPINIWDIIDKSKVETNDLYIVTIYAQATYGITVNNRTEDLVFGVRIRNTNEMAIFFDGLTYEDDTEPTSVELNGRLKFNFRVYLPILVTDYNIYYAIKLISPAGEESIVVGETFEDALYNTNIPDEAQKFISVQIPVSSYYIGEGWKIVVKSWSGRDRTINTTQTGIFDIKETNMDMFPRQHNKRHTGYGNASADTCLFAWDSYSVMRNDTWTSNIREYMPAYGDMTPIQTHADIKTYNTNGRSSGFITSGAIPYMRLQNEAYAIAHMSDYAQEITFMTNNENLYGFDISITFIADDLADDTKTVFFWGKNDGNGALSNGIKISLSQAEWYVRGTGGKTVTLRANLRQGKKTTVDFRYDGDKVYIIVDGVINSASDIGKINQSSDYAFTTNAYFATDVVNETLTNFSDISVFEFAVYTQALNPLQIAVNGKNARLEGPISNEEILNDYRDWKTKNLIYNLDTAKNKALSYLISSEGNFDYDPSSFAELQEASPIPILMINANGTDFTKAYFHKDYGGDAGVTKVGRRCAVQYFTKSGNISFNAIIKLQGTSTLSYYVKNLEMVIDDNCSEDSQKKRLLQVREDWFPEKEYTLKADIVDSAHANNATIGYWVNRECGLMEDNPAMQNFTDEWRPKDISRNGEEPQKHADTRTDTLGEEIDFDEKVTIKHTLEGFPVLVLIRFADSSNYELIGIYSFNLGRYSYYNMGLKFLKEFSRRSEGNANGTLPAIIDHYVEYGKNEPFGNDGIKTSDVFSYEFGAQADDNDPAHQTWTQDDIAILKFYGSFRFNGAAEEEDSDAQDGAPIWNKLSALFGVTATMGTANGLGAIGFEGKEKYTSDGSKLVPKGGNRYQLTADEMETFNSHMSINNAVGYFMVASALGMTDSLGKNLTLRTWDGGEKWWTAFYDMDTALGITNEGDEGISETEFIDYFENEINPTTNISELKVSQHDVRSKYGARGSKLWAIFRDGTFLYTTNGGKSYYNTAWTSLRKINGALETYSKFVALMENKIGGCGELIYDYDYQSKYIESEQNISMLHGTRIEYVRNWLKKRLYYLDGVFEDESAGAGMFSDSPFYSNKVNITNMGRAGYIPYRFTATSPTFIKINTGNVDDTNVDSYGKYFIPAHIETEIHTVPHTSTKQTSFSSSCLLTQLKGLEGINVESLNNNQAINTSKVLTALVDFSIQGTKRLQNDPIVFENANKNGTFMFAGESSLETIDMSDTAFGNSTGREFRVDLTDYQKVKYIDISNSPVSNLILPSSVLQYLNVRGSSIDTFVMKNQPVLQNIDFTDCPKISEVEISSCDGLRQMSIVDIPNLQNVSVNACASITTFNVSNNHYLRYLSITNNASLDTLTISECPSLQTIYVAGNSSLKNITISNCTDKNLQIEIIDSPLEDIRILRADTTKPIRLPDRENMANVTRFELRNIISTSGFYYGNESVEHYEDTEDYILDLTPLTSIDGENLFIVNLNVKYVRLPNDRNHPVTVNSKTFEKSDSLIRIFGHIRVIENAFYGKEHFYLNHDADYRWTSIGKLTDYSNVYFDSSELFNTDFEPAVYALENSSPLFVNDPDYTNLILDPEDEYSISSWFSSTECDINDVYYVLSLCNENTVDLSNLFAGCRFIQTFDGDFEEGKFLDINAFAKCTGVTNINNIFSGCRIDGPLFEPLLKPLINNLTDFTNVFSGKYYVISGKCFFPEGCKIEKIAGFSPNKEEGPLYDNTLLEHLSKLKYITNSFNDCSIMFDQGVYDATELFRENVGLLEIRDSFVNIEGSGSLGNLFGGYSNDATKYPNQLTTIAHSFIFRGGSHDPIFPGDDGNGILFPVGNSFLKRIAGTIKYITGSQPGENATYDDNWLYGSSTSFYGPGILKFISNFEGDLPDDYPGMDDCNGEDFPYDILKGCVNLVEFPNLFQKIHNFKNYDSYEEKESVIVINPLFKPNGESIFKDCKKLKNVSYFFNNMSNAIHCRLTGGAFKDCELVNVDNIFNGIYAIGKIPFHLFYEEGDIEYSVSGLTAAQASALGISGDEGNLVSIESGQYSVYNGTAKGGKNTIKRMQYALAYLDKSSEMSGYTLQNNEFDSVVCEDDKYSPDFEYLLEDLHYVRNTHKKKYGFDKYAYDGSSDFLTRLQNSPVWSRTDLNKDALPAEFVDTDTSDVSNWTLDKARDYTGYNIVNKSEIFAKKNYFCPPDIFKYCVNDVSTLVTGALSSVSGAHTNNGGVETIYGAIGRIPEFIFEPIDEISSIAQMFSGCLNLLPVSWGSSAENLGVLYPENLFATFKNLQDVTSVFSGTRVWRYTSVPATLFANNGNTLINASRLWAGAYWVESSNRNYRQVTVEVFAGCIIIQNVSGMFGDSRMQSIPSITPLFTYSNNRRINNCSGFLAYAGNTRGNVPTFWNDWTGMNGSQSFFGIVDPFSHEAMRELFPNWGGDAVPIEYYEQMI